MSSPIPKILWDEKGRTSHEEAASPTPDCALTAVQIRQMKKPGRHADGNGFYLVVEPSGAKRWVLCPASERTRPWWQTFLQISAGFFVRDL
jgi:hypothetical protein